MSILLPKPPQNAILAYMSTPPAPAYETATLGGGCFWCLEAIYQEVRGVDKVVSGYAGGTTPHPTYDAVTSGRTGHAEVVQVTYDPAVITYHDILNIFWAMHNPTTPNQQGNDTGPQYRSIILYHNESQHQAAQESLTAVAKLWPVPVVTEVVPLEAFYPAEPYHQNFFKSHPEQAYCQIIINPKLQHLRQQFAARLKA
jgi:peptide-methionine (S)-S-oxide reductase